MLFLFIMQQFLPLEICYSTCASTCSNKPVK